MHRLLTAVIATALLLLLPVTARAQEAGSFLFVHDVEDGPEVGVTVLPPGEGPSALIQGTVEASQSFRESLPAGSYTLAISTDDFTGTHSLTELTIRPGETTRVDLSELVTEFKDGTQRPVRRPNRIDTGAGGTAPADPATPALMALVAVCVLAVAAGRRTASAASGWGVGGRWSGWWARR